MRVKGTRKEGDPKVTIDGMPLSPDASLKVRSHSPDGFNWGYGGSGPAQLALAILLAAGVPPEVAAEGGRYQDLKREVIAGLPDEFELDLEVRPDGTWTAARPAGTA